MNLKDFIFVFALISQCAFAGPIDAGICYAGITLRINNEQCVYLIEIFSNEDVQLLLLPVVQRVEQFLLEKEIVHNVNRYAYDEINRNLFFKLKF